MAWGGKRINSGRPKGDKHAEPSKVMRVPLSRIDDIKAFLVSSPSAKLPLYSCSVRAGFPTPVDEGIESFLDLNELLVKHPSETFIVKASGDSMIDAGIHPGDLLIVDRSLEAAHGKIVIAAINGELTVKRLSRLAGQVQLLPANDKYEAINISDDVDLVIWGVVKHVIHDPL